jgi:vacuolar protein sorting-associated protein VTA1
MADPLPPAPAAFKPIQHYLKTAIEHDKRDPVVAYYCRLYALQKAMEIDRKAPESRNFLTALMNLLEQTKKQLKDQEAIQNEVVGQAHLENYAIKLFFYADNEDRAGRFGKNVVKSFYTAGMLMDVLTNFGELPEDVEKNRKYAKWKAAYIHNCLKNGETPQAGPLGDEMGEFGEEFETGAAGGGQFAAAGHPDPSNGGFGQAPSSYPSSNQPVNNHQSYPAAPPSTYQPTNPVAPLVNYSHTVGPSNPASFPSPQPAPVAASRSLPSGPSATLKPEDFTKAMKFCKFASSALQYEDAKTAIENLTKALNLLSNGHE